MTTPEHVTLRLFRFDPSVDTAPRYETYQVPYSDQMRVLDALNHVYDELDVPLAYRWFCGTKKCGECAVTVNGAPQLGCWEPALSEMTVEPLANFPIVRDLAIDTAPYERVIMGLKPYLRRSGRPAFPEVLPEAEMDAANRLYKCIECKVCSGAVPVPDVTAEGVDWQSHAGPAALVRFARFALDPRDETERRALAERAGLGTMPLYADLEGICPQGIDILRDALVPARKKLLGIEDEAPEPVEAVTVFVMARDWSGFVRLAEARKGELEAAGTIAAEDLPGFGTAYRLAAG
ncbi:MAG: hypothetical protein HOH66_15105 [Rhodospirillaceae bacterium]|jgi:fumarate reductase (CoM/CoB) subunit B|nr:hypothetical protein [Rhodospirillaceae bacterium]MBT6119188.1 hypothetical protein [Rhodospirillaceae bacterium]